MIGCMSFTTQLLQIPKHTQKHNQIVHCCFSVFIVWCVDLWQYMILFLFYILLLSFPFAENNKKKKHTELCVIYKILCGIRYSRSHDHWYWNKRIFYVNEIGVVFLKIVSKSHPNIDIKLEFKWKTKVLFLWKQHNHGGCTENANASF